MINHRNLLILIAIFTTVNLFSQEDNENIFNNNKYQLIGDFLNNTLGVYNVSDTWFSRSVYYRQSPYNSIGLKYNNVPLNSVIDGNIRGDLIPFFTLTINQPNSEADLNSNSETLSGTINCISNLSDTNQLNAVIEGGNIFGTTMFDYSGKFKQLKWKTGLSYITTGGFDISHSRPDTVSFSRNNSGFEKLSANGRLSLSDNKSFLDAEFIYTQSSQDLPYNLNQSSQVFLKETDFKFNLFNLMYRTYLNNGYMINGNIYYIRTKSILERYDDKDMNDRFLPTSFSKSFEENRFGLNTELKFDYEIIPPGKITLNYSRESLKYQQNSGLPVKNYEIEKLNLGLKFEDKLEYWEYSLGGDYRMMNPLTALENEILESKNDLEYFFNVGINLTDYIKFDCGISRRIMLPQMYLIYPEINQSELYYDPPITTINNTSEVSLDIDLMDELRFKLKYFRMEYDNIHIPLSIINNSMDEISNTLNTNGIDFQGYLKVFSAELMVRTQLIFDNSIIHDNFDREIIIPAYQVNATLSKQYQFGFRWLIDATYVGDREVSNSAATKLDDFLLLNVRLSQLLYNQNELYLQINNLTDEYYEYYRGMPMPGIYFVAGIRMLL